jgi:hypothetical protein
MISATIVDIGAEKITKCPVERKRNVNIGQSPTMEGKNIRHAGIGGANWPGRG